MEIQEKTLEDQTVQRLQSAEGSNSSLSGRVGHVSEPICLDRNRFSVLGAVGIQWSATAAPLSICASLQLVIGGGGSPFYFWAFVVAASFQLMTALSLAELASAFPHTTGQAYWASRLAPDGCSKFLTYWVGICGCWGWLFGLAGSAVFTAEFLLALRTLTVSSFQRELWQVYLTVLAIGMVSLVVNTVGIKPFSKSTFPSIIFLNAATIFIFVSLLVETSPKASASTVFIDVRNYTGWPSNGIVFLLNFLPGNIAISLFDAPAHAADEMPRPAEQVPKVMIGTTILNIVSTLIMLIGVLFCLKNPENLLEPMAGLAILQLCWDAFPRMGFVVTVAAIYCCANIFATISMAYTCSRLIWSFSQTGGLHGRRWLLKVNTELQVPVNAVVLTVVLMCLANLLVLGPSTVLNSMFGAAGFFFSNSYCIPIFLLLIKGRNALPQDRSFNLGRFGIAINVAALCYSSVTTVIINFPTFIPVTPLTMNWTSAYIVACAAVTLGNWYRVRHSYQPPLPLYEGSIDSPEAHQASAV
ncbi:putative amino acid transporter [Dactylonectria macrodidyma]|uniref:Amino acid transporter n=1 Tax=Dactylonectria macrodidyma TaxID=307937 RepID=A0A9P9JJN8_9HYPO|nr:putative amino acid transporter [Dactylonectria macrodidyma]